MPVDGVVAECANPRLAASTLVHRNRDVITTADSYVVASSLDVERREVLCWRRVGVRPAQTQGRDELLMLRHIHDPDDDQTEVARLPVEAGAADVGERAE